MKEIQMKVFEGERQAIISYPAGPGNENYLLTSFVMDRPVDKRTTGASWFVLTNSGRVWMSVCEKSVGGWLMDGAEIRQEPPEFPPMVLRSEGKKSRVSVFRPIPENGKVIVSRGNQRFEFSYSEK